MILQGDCLDVLKDVPDESFTAIVTDPPYGLEFMGKGWDKVLPPIEVWRECLRVLKPGGHALIFGGTRTYHRLACAVEDAGFEVRDCLMWLYGQGFPKSMDVSKAIDKAAGAERDVVVGTKLGRPGMAKDGSNQSFDSSANTYGTGGVLPSDITAPATEAARQWSGWGTALKPAWEPIILARKPLVGTVERNCREHGTGALNIDGCRIGTEGGGTHCANRDESGKCKGHQKSEWQTRHGPDTEGGRWPANLILDEEAGAMLDEQSGPMKDGVAVNRNRGARKKSIVNYANHDGTDAGYGGGGGASRFFYCAKASKRDRGDGNTHPTVKPTELMRWLVRLVKGPEDSLILDPFAGSGSTGVACQIEGVPFLLIEREAAYAEIIERRLNEPMKK